MEIPKRRNHPLQVVVLIQALLAMLGSLYYSTFGDPVTNAQFNNFFPADAGFVPCNLCRWSRILMYPIVWISIWGLYRRDRKVVTLIQWISWAGILLSTFHYLMQKTSLFQIDAFCTLENPCSALMVDYFGIATIPFLALIAYVIIFICCQIVRTHSGKEVELEHHHF